jgi:hypothetical protein
MKPLPIIALLTLATLTAQKSPDSKVKTIQDKAGSAPASHTNQPEGLLPGQPMRFLGGVEPRWNLAAYHPAEGYMAAVVYDGAPCSIKYLSVDSHLE